MRKIAAILLLGFCFIIFCDAQIANLYSLSSENIVPYAENIDNDFIEFDEEYTIMHNTISNSVLSDISIRISSQYMDDSKYGFNSIAIYKDGDILLKLQQEQLWTYMFDGMTTKDYRDLTDSKYYILKECGDAILLIFAGWPYDEDYPYLTMIAMNASTTKLVYHKQAELVDIIDTENGFQIVYRPNDDKGKTCNFTYCLTQEQNQYADLLKVEGTLKEYSVTQNQRVPMFDFRELRKGTGGR